MKTNLTESNASETHSTETDSIETKASKTHSAEIDKTKTNKPETNMAKSDATEVDKPEANNFEDDDNAAQKEFETEYERRRAVHKKIDDRKANWEWLTAEICMEFLAEWSPADIEKSLNEYVIGQPEVTAAVADFLHYHMLRQVYPTLKPRSLLISGPSGCGKTEAFRAASKIFHNYVSINIIDGSMISGEGWTGNYKIFDAITPEIAYGGILVIDEFDKLTKPMYSSHGNNTSLIVQDQLLTLIEGEYTKADPATKYRIDTKQMSLAFIGAFESIRSHREQKSAAPTIGFREVGSATANTSVANESYTADDFIKYGVIPEIMSRIAISCTANALTADDYRNIIKQSITRNSSIMQILKLHKIPIQNVISDQELDNLIAKSTKNHTGARWVKAQIERNLLSNLHDIHMSFNNLDYTNYDRDFFEKTYE